MKIFTPKKNGVGCSALARAEAAAGGQALAVYPWHGQAGPRCFRRAAEIGKLYDQDAQRLADTARGLGVRRVVIEHLFSVHQHVSLCGRPLHRAIEAVEKCLPSS